MEPVTCEPCQSGDHHDCDSTAFDGAYPVACICWAEHDERMHPSVRNWRLG